MVSVTKRGLGPHNTARKKGKKERNQPPSGMTHFNPDCPTWAETVIGAFFDEGAQPLAFYFRVNTNHIPVDRRSMDGEREAASIPCRRTPAVTLQWRRTRLQKKKGGT